MTSQELGARLSTLRQKAGITQKTIAASLKMSAANVSLIEGGRVNTSLDNLTAFAELVGAKLYVDLVVKGSDQLLLADLIGLLDGLTMEERGILQGVVKALQENRRMRST